MCCENVVTGKLTNLQNIDQYKNLYILKWTNPIPTPEFFTKSPRYKNANITNFILIVPLEMYSTANLNSIIQYQLISNFTFANTIIRR